MITGHRVFQVDAYISQHNGNWTTHCSMWEGQKHLYQHSSVGFNTQLEAEDNRDFIIDCMMVVVGKNMEE